MMRRNEAIMGLALVLACLGAMTLGAQPRPTTEQRLSHCLADLSEATQVQAAFYGGQLGTQEAFVAAFETANPGKTLTATLTIADKK